MDKYLQGELNSRVVLMNIPEKIRGARTGGSTWLLNKKRIAFINVLEIAQIEKM
jgi:hypothetical protein